MSDVADTPKRRNWVTRIVRSRDFSRDIMVTTLGVLIALGIGAVVDAIGWRMRLAATERMMNEELSIFRGVSAYNWLTGDCAFNKVDALTEILESSRTSKVLPRIENIGFTRDFGAFGDSWQLAQGSDVMLHMKPKDAMDHASRWVNIRYVSSLASDAQEAWQQLTVLQDRPGPIAVETIDGIAKDLIVAGYAVGMGHGVGSREDSKLGEEGIPRLMPNGTPWNLAEMKKLASSAPICEPLLVDGKPYRLKKKNDPIDLPPDLVG